MQGQNYYEMSSTANYPFSVQGRPQRKSARKTPMKLRVSCDCCSTAKVRCSKDKPSCERCRRRGTECTYSLSRRAGRRPQKTPPTTTPTTTPSNTPITLPTTASNTTSSSASPEEAWNDMETMCETRVNTFGMHLDFDTISPSSECFSQQSDGQSGSPSVYNMSPHDWLPTGDPGTTFTETPCMDSGISHDCLDDINMAMLSNPWSLDMETMSTLLLPSTYNAIYGSEFDMLDPSMDLKQRYGVQNNVDVDFSWNSESDLSVLSL